MLRLFFLALTAVVIVAVGYVIIPRNTSRPGLNSSSANPPTHFTAPLTSPPDPNAFVVHDAAPPAAPLPPVPAPPQASSAVPPSGTFAGQAPGATTASNPADPAATSNLDLLMHRLRASSDPGSPPAPATPPGPAVPPAQPPPVVAPPVVAPVPPPASRWTNVTAQGTRWHMTPAGGGYTIAIDLGGGRLAEVHVLPAIANLDSAGVNQRVDYLKQTILQNFPPESASYTFARDGSVSLNN